MSKYKKLAAAAAVTAALAGSMAFTPVRAIASEFLNLFRIEKMQTVNVDPNQLRNASQVFYNAQRELKIDNFGEFSNDIKTNSTRSISLEEAKKSAHFRVMDPQYLPPGVERDSITSESEKNINFKLNVVNVNAILKYIGAKKLLPENLSGKNFSLHIPTMVNMSWHRTNSTGNQSTFVNITQTLSPEFKVPNGVDANQIRDAVLALPIIPDSIKSQLTNIEDWQHTLPIPSIKDATREVDINGVKGIFMEPAKVNEGKGMVGFNTLLYQKDGVLTIINGNIPYEETIKVAKSMR